MENKYLKLNENELRKLQGDLLPLLVEVDRICRKHSIQYFLSDGTLLGAIRHKGFIPWDDDIDIHMLRNDYEKFCEVCKKELNDNKFFLQHNKNDVNYNWTYGKLRMKNTEYVREGQEHLQQWTGIFMDIFPIDGASNSLKVQYIQKYVCKMCRKILWSNVGKKVEKNIVKRIFYKVLTFIPRISIISVFEFVSKLLNNRSTDYLTSNNLQYRNDKKYRFRKEWYEKTVEVEFEGYKLLAPAGYDEILTLTYGNYMDFPPESERHGRCFASHIIFLDGSELKIESAYN